MIFHLILTFHHLALQQRTFYFEKGEGSDDKRGNTHYRRVKRRKYTGHDSMLMDVPVNLCITQDMLVGWSHHVISFLDLSSVEKRSDDNFKQDIPNKCKWSQHGYSCVKCEQRNQPSHTPIPNTSQINQSRVSIFQKLFWPWSRLLCYIIYQRRWLKKVSLTILSKKQYLVWSRLYHKYLAPCVDATFLCVWKAINSIFSAVCLGWVGLFVNSQGGTIWTTIWRECI